MNAQPDDIDDLMKEFPGRDPELLKNPDFVAGMRAGRKAAIEHPPTDAQLQAYVRRLDSTRPRPASDGHDDD